MVGEAILVSLTYTIEEKMKTYQMLEPILFIVFMSWILAVSGIFLILFAPFGASKVMPAKRPL